MQKRARMCTRSSAVITEGNETSVRLHEKYGFLHCGCIHEVGVKFGKPLGIVNMELIV